MIRVWKLVLVLSITVIGFANGQGVPPCLGPLSPCIDFLNSTKPPPQTCCNPVKEVNANQNSCFCELALTPGALEALGTTLSHAIQLLQSCGVNFKLTSCKGYSLLLHSNFLLASKPFYLIQHIKFYFILLFSKFQHLSLRLRLQVRILSIFFFSFITIIFFHFFIHDFAATVGGDEGGTSRATFSGLSFALFLCVYAMFN